MAERREVGSTDRIDFFHDSNSGEKSLQWDAIVGRWDGHTR